MPDPEVTTGDKDPGSIKHLKQFPLLEDERLLCAESDVAEEKPVLEGQQA